jgi:hypothetical protein
MVIGMMVTRIMFIVTTDTGIMMSSFVIISLLTHTLIQWFKTTETELVVQVMIFVHMKEIA